MSALSKRSNLISVTGTATLLLTVAGCASQPRTDELGIDPPLQWVHAEQSTQTNNGWLAQLNDPQLDALVQQVIAKNHTLKLADARLAQTRESAVIAGANRLPVLTLDLDASSREVANITTDSFGLGANLRWQADIWGEFSDRSRSAALAYAAAVANYQGTRRNIIAQSARAWYDWLEANELLSVAIERKTNAEQSLAIVNSAYQQGLNDALDLYLARSSLEQQNASVAEQTQRRLEAGVSLQLLLGEYPAAPVTEVAALVYANVDVANGVPSELLTRRADVNEAWQLMLAADADLAVAHKQRFPALTISANVSDDAASFSDAFDGRNLVTSLIGNLTQPLFNGGRLRASERRAQARVLELEQIYLNLVNTAYADVENAISRGGSLRLRFHASVKSRDNANQALQLASEQYQRGLVTYTTVLDAQRRAFDARVSVVQLTGQILRNRIDLYQALAIDAVATTATEK